MKAEIKSLVGVLLLALGMLLSVDACVAGGTPAWANASSSLSKEIGMVAPKIVGWNEALMSAGWNAPTEVGMDFDADLEMDCLDDGWRLDVSMSSLVLIAPCLVEYQGPDSSGRGFKFWLAAAGHSGRAPPIGQSGNHSACRELFQFSSVLFAPLSVLSSPDQRPLLSRSSVLFGESNSISSYLLNFMCPLNQREAGCTAPNLTASSSTLRSR